MANVPPDTHTMSTGITANPMVRLMAGESLLASWSDSPTRAAITSFVASVTEEGSSAFVPEVDRIAVFDNDGTLWTEKPIPIQLDFTLHRMAEQAKADAALADQEPYRSALAQDYRWLGATMVKHYRGDDADLKVLMAAVSKAVEGTAVEDFAADVRDCARSPTVSTGSPRSGSSAAHSGSPSTSSPTSPACCTSRRSSSSTTGRRNRSASGAGSGAARWWPWATRTATSRCSASPAAPIATG
jgi:hypothetical protein